MCHAELAPLPPDNKATTTHCTQDIKHLNELSDAANSTFLKKLPDWVERIVLQLDFDD